MTSSTSVECERVFEAKVSSAFVLGHSYLH